MIQRLAVLFIACLILYPAASANAQDPQPPTDGWRATYWNNPSLAGFWRLQQNETEPLDRHWGEAAPHSQINVDYWSARWERTIRVSPGNYRFTATVDNGIRVFIDGESVIDAWASQWQSGGGTFTGDIYLGGGEHLLTVEYFDATGEAYVQLDWGPYVGPPPVVEGWLAEYYNNVDLAGPPVLIRDEPEIQMNLQAASPAPDTVNADNFSVRWTRDLDLPAGIIEFAIRVDDGGRLFVDGEQVLDGWRPQGPTTYTTTVQHNGGPLPVTMEYFERTGYAVAEFSWEKIADLPDLAEVEPVSTPLTTTPTLTGTTAPLAQVSLAAEEPSLDAVIVDDGATGFVWGNPFIRRVLGEGGYGSGFISSPNQQRISNNYAWVRWYPTISAGRYEVLVFVPELEAGSGRPTRSARYWVQHTNQYTLHLVDQEASTGRWISLGIYEFNGNQREYISLANITGEATGTTVVLWDAVRWEPME